MVLQGIHHILPILDYYFDHATDTVNFVFPKLRPLCPQSLEDCEKYFCQLANVRPHNFLTAQVLNVLHSKGITHHDISPSICKFWYDNPTDNLLLSNTGDLVLIDFEFARLTSSCNHTEEFCPGTDRFKDPNMWKSEKCSPLYDCYGLGAVLAYWVPGCLALTMQVANINKVPIKDGKWTPVLKKYARDNFAIGLAKRCLQPLTKRPSISEILFALVKYMGVLWMTQDLALQVEEFFWLISYIFPQVSMRRVKPIEWQIWIQENSISYEHINLQIFILLHLPTNLLLQCGPLGTLMQICYKS